MSPSDSQPAPFDGKAFVSTLSNSPGVYRMFGANDELLYVGKAGSLKKRVGSYFLKVHMDPRVAAMIQQIARIETTVTRTEAEALLLEAQLIKSLKPRYNIVLRDDKSYPYIHLTPGEYPRLAFHRGARSGGGKYFGPFPSAGAVRESLNLIQKLFRIRNCEDSYFRNRSRPCLQHQIGRCTAPCVGLIEPEAYGENVRHAAMFLDGRAEAVMEELVASMERARSTSTLESANWSSSSRPAGALSPRPASPGTRSAPMRTPGRSTFRSIQIARLGPAGVSMAPSNRRSAPPPPAGARRAPGRRVVVDSDRVAPSSA